MVRPPGMSYRRSVKKLASSLALALLAGCASPSVDEAPPPAPEGSPLAAAREDAPAAALAQSDVATQREAPPAEPGGRQLTEAARSRMVEILGRDSGDQRRVWIAVAAGLPEPIALRGQFRSAFDAAGIGVEEVDLRGLRLKPGLRALIAGDPYPPWIDTLIEALEASGLEIPAARGYRSYYEEMKEKNPNWPGIPISEDAEVILVFGPETGD